MHFKTPGRAAWLAAALIALPFALHAAPRTAKPVAAAPDVIADWNAEARNAIVIEGSGTYKASRQLAIVNVAVFDAVNAVERRYRPYRVDTRAEPGASAEAAAVAAARDALAGLFPKLARKFDARQALDLARIPEGPAKEAGLRLGRDVAAQVLAWRAADGHDAKVEYTPPTGPGKWAATPGDTSIGLTQWPKIPPFGLLSADQFRSPPPPALDSAEYAESFRRLKEKGGRAGSTRTPEETQIALFWGNQEGTYSSAGHFNRITEIVARQQKLSLVDRARLFALVGIAQADVSIATLESKYHYLTWRPQEAIRNGEADGNPATAGDPAWESLLRGAGPDYPSTLSANAGATIAILKAVLGRDDIPVTVDSHALWGVQRSFGTLTAIADEAGGSRSYSGFHFSYASREGRQGIGDKIGRWVVANHLLPADRRAPSSPLASR
ncbi:vanadium-dependent haloperoxidase [uncultured Methylibium sp.]|uniref:vanadium-dependent haloperoxidase n=1 Tax=uncultured Methylibium sp. TaxID=381093 RepID=UPI0025CDFE78|nr:vanadium-dependent haloperoxidase [uncultured Methylibium sp.]